MSAENTPNHDTNGPPYPLQEAVKRDLERMTPEEEEAYAEAAKRLLVEGYDE